MRYILPILSIVTVTVVLYFFLRTRNQIEHQSIAVLVPDNFSGSIKMHFEQSSGILLQPGSLVTIEVPASGSLSIKNPNIMAVPNSWTAQTKSGKPLPLNFGPIPCRDDLVAFRNVGVSKYEAWFVVGDSAAAATAIREFQQVTP